MSRVVIYIVLILCCTLLVSRVTLGQTFTDVAQALSIQPNINTMDNYGASVSFYDFNQDGLDDLTFAQENDSILFYQNNGNGFDQIASFAYGDGQVKQVSWIDIDNDHDMDLFISVYNGTSRLLINDGNFNFTDNSTVAGLPTSNTENYGASFADFNNDGYLDFYLANYVYGYAANDYEHYNRLYKNNGDGTFSNVTLSAGVGDSIKTTFQGLWFDWNQDGWIDLYVINDRYPFENKLFRNNGDETFTDVTAGSGLEFPGGNPMTITIDDFNNDSYPDIYTTNVGNGNPTQFFVNNGDGTFSEQSQSLGTQMDIYTWGALWIDYDNDTWQDLYVATGHPSSFFSQTKSAFFQNQAGQYFTQNDNMFLGDLMGASFSVAKGDIDNDGYYDIVSFNDDNEDPFLWQNSGGNNNYVKITLEGTASNYNAIGSQIQVFANGTCYSKYTYSVENYIAQNSQHIIFGLGQASIIDSLKVLYPGGHLDKYYNVQVNTHHYLKEGETTSTSIQVIGDSLFCSNVDAELYIDTQDSINWNTGATTNDLFISNSGTYYAYVILPGYSYSTDTVYIGFSTVPQIIESTEGVSCHGFSDGSAELFINAALDSTDYSVSWSDGSNGLNQNNLSSGIYEYYYEDIYGCADTGEVVIESPFPLSIIANTSSETNGNDGVINLLANGGTPPYEYLFNGSPLLPPYENLSAGNYGISIVDQEGCSLDTIISVGSVLSLENSIDDDFLVGPNPLISNEINITTPNGLEKIEIRLYEQVGKLIYQQHFNSWDAGTHSIELPNLGSGYYQFTLRSNTVYQTFKTYKE